MTIIGQGTSNQASLDSILVDCKDGIAVISRKGTGIVGQQREVKNPNFYPAITKKEF